MSATCDVTTVTSYDVDLIREKSPRPMTNRGEMNEVESSYNYVKEFFDEWRVDVSVFWLKECVER